MPSRSPIISLLFGGGWATDFGGSTHVGIDPNSSVTLPFFVDAEDCEYALDGGVRKIGGQTKLNSSVVESGADITLLFDYWKQGTGGSPTQKRVIFVAGKIFKDDADGTFDELKSGLTDGAIANAFVFDDILIMANSSTADVPMSWDQTTFQNLAGSPPNFSFGVAHKNHVFAAGVASVPSRLFFSVPLDPEDWGGSGSGSIDIDPNDGDEIRGLASWKNELWVFKGPNKGSIHRITGSSSSDWARTTFNEGIPCAGHNTIFQFKDDLGFMSFSGSIHSLKATSSFGDFNEATLSQPINTWLQEHVNKTTIKRAWAMNYQPLGRVLFTMPIDGSNLCNRCIMMDYRFDPPRWSNLPSYDNLGAIGVARDATDQGQRKLFGGHTDGFVRELFTTERSIDSTGALSFRVGFPQMNFLLPGHVKTLVAAGLGIVPAGAFDVTMELQPDTDTATTLTFDQAGGDVLGSWPSNQFQLGTSTLAGSGFIDRLEMVNTVGSFRNLHISLLQSGVGEDVEIHHATLKLDVDAESFQ